MSSLALAGPTAAAGKAEHVIYLFMKGAMSHVNTLDPKPRAAAGDQTTALPTSVSGLSIGNYLRLLTKQMHRLAVIRSMTTETGAHEQGVYPMRTSFKLIGTIRHLSLGSWVTRVVGDAQPATRLFL